MLTIDYGKFNDGYKIAIEGPQGKLLFIAPNAG